MNRKTDAIMPILLVENMSSSYEGQALLKQITFALQKGEILCLLGPSGSGKTTLLRMLAGLECEDSGTITFAGLNIQAIPSHRRNFGMMFQEYALFPHKNVFDNVCFGLEMMKIGPKNLESRVTEMLEIVGLNGFEHRAIDDLSGGERQRVALARALAPQPQLLLLDEPLGSLDRTLRDRLAGEIRSILKNLDVTALFVTHDQSEAFSVADKVAILIDGKIEQFDCPEKLYRNPVNKTVANFLGFKNIVNGEFDVNGNFCSPLGKLHLVGDFSYKQESSLLIRPEGARIRQATGVVEGDDVALTGRVVERKFQGATYKLHIQVGGQVLFFDLPLDPTPAGVNTTIKLTIKRSALVWLNS